MTPRLTLNLLRALFVTFTTCVGLMLSYEIFHSAVSGLFAGAAFGLLIVLFDRLLNGISLRVFSSATFGLLVGFLFSQLLLASNFLAAVAPQWQWVIALAVYSTFGYLGMMLAIRSNRDEFALIIPYVRFRRATVQDTPLLIDTNIVIDGRIAEICATGFLSSSLVVPRFVVDELHRLSESNDASKRERGRTGLERLSRMQLDPKLSVTIHEVDPDAQSPVDIQLVKLAVVLEARLLTNDATICQIARMQNVAVLNLNDLTRALRPQLAAGDEVQLSLVKEGRDAHQAVGYLPDGTMIVVNHGRPHLGRTVPVTIASALQTSAGRLFFAELRAA
jgi:uncharacterized protein YacL